MIKIAIIDDHTVIRSGLRDYLDSQPDLQVVGEGDTGRDALALTSAQQVDVLLMDLCMPGQNGMDALADMMARSPEVRILILSGYPESLYALNMLQQGAWGFLNKNCAPEDIIAAVRTIAAGRLFLPPGVQRSKPAPEGPTVRAAQRS